MANPDTTPDAPASAPELNDAGPPSPPGKEPSPVFLVRVPVMLEVRIAEEDAHAAAYMAAQITAEMAGRQLADGVKLGPVICPSAGAEEA